MIGARTRARPGLLALTLLAGALAWLLALVCVAAPASPQLSARVTDEVGVLSPPIRESLERRLAAYEASSGHQIVVWIGRGGGESSIEAFAVEAFEQWKIGRAGLDDGLGVFVFVDERAVRVEVGYGLEPKLTDLEASRVIRNVMTPRFEAGEWDAGVVAGVEALVDVIEGETGSLPLADDAGPQVPERASKAQIIATVIGVGLFFILLITNPRLALLLLFFVGRGGRGGGIGGGGFQGGGGGSGGGGATGRW